MARTTLSHPARGKLASLAEYRRKRDFGATPEPRGGRAGAARSFFVQKHAARRLHYDFRLELHGTLKSWAVPKGPSMQAGTKRLAVHVEDHPIEYGSFEGEIPKGQYGAGKVEVWDRGTWEPIGDADEGYREGHLKFRLKGHRLKGVWNLVRMGGAASGDGKNWLLIKDKDGATKPERLAARPARLAAVRPRRVPSDFTPQLAMPAKEVPAGDDWLFEVKLDGYRILARIIHGRARLISRNLKDWSARFPSVLEAVEALPIKSAVLDGEVVALRRDGTPDFQLLQNAQGSRTRTKLAYYVFDLPFHEGHDLREVPLVERKRQLARLLAGRKSGLVRYGDHVRGDGETLLKEACALGLEGIIAKRADATYQSRRSPAWRKIKCSGRQEFIVVGWTDPQGARKGFGSLLLAHHDAASHLVYSGKVGTGFGERAIDDLMRRMRRLAIDRHPLDLPPPRGEIARAHWIRPELVAEIRFTEWTADGRLRHPSFLGLRDDKEAREVIRETAPRAAAAPKAKAAPEPGLTHPERVLWPETGLTKAGLAAYYDAVADLMLAHLVGRPLAIVRCPEGLAKPCFFQKHIAGRSSETITVDDLEGLHALVQIGALEIHAWGASSDRLERPDRLVIDLDPGPRVPFARVVETAVTLRDRLEALDITSFVRTSGGKGLHVVAPLARRASWDDLKAFTRALAAELVRREPKLYVAEAAKSRRVGRIFVDWLRNARGATAVASYSTRARPEASVAMPLRWEDLPKVASGDAFHVGDVPKRIAKAGDPWHDFFAVHASIPAKARHAGRR